MEDGITDRRDVKRDRCMRETDRQIDRHRQVDREEKVEHGVTERRDVKRDRCMRETDRQTQTDRHRQVDREARDGLPHSLTATSIHTFLSISSPSNHFTVFCCSLFCHFINSITSNLCDTEKKCISIYIYYTRTYIHT